MTKKISDLKLTKDLKEITKVVLKYEPFFNEISNLSKKLSRENKAILFVNILTQCFKQSAFPFIFIIGDTNFKMSTTLTNIDNQKALIEILEDILKDKIEELEHE